MRWVYRTGLVVMIAIAIGFGYFWYTFQSPYGYEAPTNPPIVDRRLEHHTVFVYGTLRYAPIRWLVMGRAGTATPATLPGYVRDELDISPAPNKQVDGYTLSITSDELKQLDRYEHLGKRYRRVNVKLASNQSAWVYQRL
ncbi:gamma-glutamylcyclotransferase family protein [Chromohalobacter sp. HP20-39]|uniref:gamma-glutamylcyclotransferase family protein n=1 Tax=Chromohalobacter sp. HP20-39 TaxID=3079306 RepID=UPI00294B96AA|nr:gamma-glutamylcyclotransferase family protein [Chromohalobacter sp. HP20-39]MDV6319232.1 gamma-glutamylcyclotransferase family protein [Chromohalobacter sp. HP20-39]